MPLPEFRTVELPGDQFPVPSENGLGLDDGDGVSHKPAEGNSLLCKNDALGVGQENTLFDLLSIDI